MVYNNLLPALASLGAKDIVLAALHLFRLGPICGSTLLPLVCLFFSLQGAKQMELGPRTI